MSGTIVPGETFVLGGSLSKPPCIIRAVTNKTTQHTKKLLGFTTIAILLLAFVPAVSVAAAQSQQVRAKQFIEIAEAARNHATNLKELASSRGISTTSAQRSLTEGEDLLAQANAALASTPPDFAKASEKAREAMSRFRDAARTLGSEVEQQGLGRPAEVRGLLEAINRTELRVSRFMDIMNSLNLAANDATRVQAEEKIAEAREKLQNATAKLEGIAPGEELKPESANVVSEAARILGDANQLIAEAHILMARMAGSTYAARAEAFSQAMTEATQRAQQAIDRARAAGVPVERVQALQARLQSALTLIQDAIQLFKDASVPKDPSIIQDAVAKLQQAISLLQQVHQEAGR